MSLAKLGWGNWMKMVKRYKLPFIIMNVIYNVILIINAV